MTQRRTMFAFAFAGLVVGGLVVGATWKLPLRVLTAYPAATLVEEAREMDECAECHEGQSFHTCQTCHDDHGALEMTEVPFYAGITLEGDVPAPGYVLLDQIMPYRDRPYTHVSLVDFLASQDAGEFESVTMASLDGGFVTVARENLTDQALLMPYIDGIRFAAEDLHVSSWIKGIRRVIVVGTETPLLVDGTPTSIGRLLAGPTMELTVEETTVLLKSEEDGETRQAQAGTRILGVPVTALVANPAFGELVVGDAAGETHVLAAEELQGAVVAQFRGKVMLVLPDRGRAQWISDVVSLESR